MKKLFRIAAPLLMVAAILFYGYQEYLQRQTYLSLADVPDYSGAAYVVLEQNQPDFSQEQFVPGTERYSQLDILGRCGETFAVIGPETMPQEERGAIGQVKPSGWHLAKYDCVDGKYLYNRCHLIGYQLSGENANEQNLITGTRYLNVDGMLPYENQVADYVESTGNHVFYRSTPIFQGTELVARGVQLEAWSVEDEGAGVCFNVYLYNVQPGVEIDYATGESWLAGEQRPAAGPEQSPQQEEEITYILNTKSQRFHLPDCSGAASTSQQNKQSTTLDRQTLIEQGYTPCGQCKP